MTFRLHDTLRQATVDFVPLVPGKASIYHCGLTVQSAPHLGHIRKEVVFDVLRRWLSYSGYEVKIVANVTDIDDRILTKSADAGEPWYELAYRMERELHLAYAALGCIPPSYEPRATGHIPEMIELIEILLERGHAYVAADESGDVYFDVASWPQYGELSHQRIGDMAPAEDADPRGKRDPRDFALWKGHKPDEPLTASWPAPWGRGRPGWHLECSAMAGKYLGDAFDIHGGGIDLRFPHHENELAQSRAAGRPFTQYWMHNAFVTAAGEKMSKSLSNGALVSVVTQQYAPRAVRLYLLAPHYRSTIEHSDASLAEASAQLSRIDSFYQRAVALVGRPEVLPPVPSAFVEAMDDDLGTPAAMAVLFGRIKDGNQSLESGQTEAVAFDLGEVISMLAVLGLDPAAPEWSGTQDAGLREVADGLITELVNQRTEARARKDWAAADQIRDALGSLGVTLEDSRDGVRWSIN